MLGLNRKESRVFRFSLVGHGLVALGCAVFGFLPSCEEEEEKVHVFELASSSPFPTIPAPQLPTPPKAVEPKPTPPKPKPTPPRAVEPKPTPPKVVKPKPKPTPPKVVKPKPKPQPPQTVSFSQFKKDHKLPDPPTRKPKPAPIKPAPRIDGSKYTLPAPKLGNSSSRSSVPQSVLDAYLSQVQAKMDRVWKRLQSATDLGFGGEARLSFRISSNGTIVSAKLSKLSGNKALDDLVLRVSRSVGNVGAPPGGKLDSALEIPFVVN